MPSYCYYILLHVLTLLLHATGVLILGTTICVLILLLYMCPSVLIRQDCVLWNDTLYVSSYSSYYYYICVLIRQDCVLFNDTLYVSTYSSVSSYYYCIRVLILLILLLYTCPHTPHYTCVLIRQDCVLFNDTLEYNVRYGNEEATPSQVCVCVCARARRPPAC